MMGQHARSEALFYYFRLDDQVPENHLLRLIEKHISFAFVRERLKDSYSETGRPSIDPELLLRILLIGYLYGITSERKLVEELGMHLAWRWFTGLGFDREIPHHSTCSKNRHGRFQQSCASSANRQDPCGLRRLSCNSSVTKNSRNCGTWNRGKIVPNAPFSTPTPGFVNYPDPPPPPGFSLWIIFGLPVTRSPGCVDLATITSNTV